MNHDYVDNIVLRNTEEILEATGIKCEELKGKYNTSILDPNMDCTTRKKFNKTTTKNNRYMFTGTHISIVGIH